MNRLSNPYQLTLLVYLISTAYVSAVAQSYPNSIVSTDFDLVSDEDPSCFVALRYQGIEKAEMPDKTRDGGLFGKAHIFVATYSDDTSVQLAIDSTIDTELRAKTEALRYATRLGKLPTVLRAGVERLVVHEGNPDATAFSDVGLIVVYSDNATKRIATHDLEETLFHESVHAAWDKKYAKSPEWLKAQVSDGTFATLYAKKNPSLEDLAESALFAYAVIHHPDRLPPADLERIQRAIPARILFVERLIPMDKPIFSDADKH